MAVDPRRPSKTSFSSVLVWTTCKLLNSCQSMSSSMVCPRRSWYELHLQLHNQECLLYCSLHRSLSLRSSSPSTKPPISQRAPKFHRRRGFSNRRGATIAMFVTTVINFILSSLNTGGQVALFIVFIRKALMIIPDINYPAADKPQLINNALRNVNIITLWASVFPVSTKSVAVKSCIY